MNIVIPVLILEHCSEGAVDMANRTADQKFWEIGPLWAMIVALGFPIVYGVWNRLKQGKFDLMSGVGLAGVLLTGVISLVVVSSTGEIHRYTPWLFSVKEGAVPLVMAAAVWVSSRSDSPLIRSLIYTDEVFRVVAIEQSIRERGVVDEYARLMRRMTWILAGSFLFSSLANMAVAYVLMAPVVTLPPAEQQVAYNVAVGRIAWWGFLVIGAPLMVALGCAFANLIATLKRLTGFSQQELLK